MLSAVKLLLLTIPANLILLVILIEPELIRVAVAPTILVACKSPFCEILPFNCKLPEIVTLFFILCITVKFA